MADPSDGADLVGCDGRKGAVRTQMTRPVLRALRVCAPLTLGQERPTAERARSENGATLTSASAPGRSVCLNASCHKFFCSDPHRYSRGPKILLYRYVVARPKTALLDQHRARSWRRDASVVSVLMTIAQFSSGTCCALFEQPSGTCSMWGAFRDETCSHS